MTTRPEPRLTRTPDSVEELIAWLEGRLQRRMADWERGKLLQWLRRIAIEFQG